MLLSAAPQSETPTVSFQGHHITMQPAFTVRLRAPQANWTPHKASDNCCPSTVGLSAGTLYQVLNAAAAAMNEIIGGGAAMGWGHHRVVVVVVGVHSLKPYKNSRTICVQGRAVLLPPPRVSGLLCADRQAGGLRQRCPFLLTAFKASFPLTHHAAPRLIPDLCHRGTRFFFFTIETSLLVIWLKSKTRT